MNRIRARLYRRAGLRIGKNVAITGPISISLEYSDRVSIGDGTYLNFSTRFGVKDSQVRIGRRCLIGPRVSFETASHELIHGENGERGMRTLPICLGDYVWIGSNAVILQGVEIGTGSVVAAGAIVNKNVPPYSLVGGIPAKLIKPLQGPSKEV